MFSFGSFSAVRGTAAQLASTPVGLYMVVKTTPLFLSAAAPKRAVLLLAAPEPVIPEPIATEPATPELIANKPAMPSTTTTESATRKPALANRATRVYNDTPLEPPSIGAMVRFACYSLSLDMLNACAISSTSFDPRPSRPSR
ncbi:hypothetical protein GGI03_005465 [Coemansia sp. RSA 2337]|nr:hypothetical protein GGI03_005465 [Coemansia sp. RSA 2337]